MFFVALALALVPNTLPGLAGPTAPDQWICPPCGTDCHSLRAEAGDCPGCGMALAPAANYPRVGVLLYEGCDLASSAPLLACLATSRKTFVTSVADTTDALDTEVLGALVPDASFASAPALDILVVPGGRGAYAAQGDALVTGWIAEQGARARCVLAVGSGALLVARAGLLQAGQVAVGSDYLAERLEDLSPDATLVRDRPVAVAQQVITTRDGSAGARVALSIVARLSDVATAQRVAALQGIEGWPREGELDDAWQLAPVAAAAPPTPPTPAVPPREDARAADPAAGAPTRSATSSAAYATTDWSAFRGPARDGSSPERGWSTRGEELWRRAVGLGHSSASIAGQRLVTLGFDVEREEDVAWCLDAATGEELWARRWPAQRDALGHGGGTLTTPTVTGARVFLTTRRGSVRCLAAEDGTSLWERDLAAEFELEPTGYGFGGSPLLHAGVVYVNLRSTFALEAETGEVLWTSREHLAMYSTPAPLEIGGRACLAVFTKEGLAVLDRGDGAELWFHPWRKGESTVNCLMPIVLGERVFLASAYQHGCALLGFEEEGGERRVVPVFESLALRAKLGGVVRVGEYLYGLDEAVLKCIDLEGNERWRKRGLGLGSISAADGRLLILTKNGELVVARATPEAYVELARDPVFERGSVLWSAPVLCAGRLYLRSGEGELICRDHRLGS